MYKGSLKNLTTHSYIDFQTSNTKVSVNLGINEEVATFNDFSVGANTFKLDVYHIYSTNMHEANSKMGNNWKLNIEQYIYPYQESYNLGYSVGDYLYIDDTNCIHHFVKYKDNKYYEDNGSGLILQVLLNGYKIIDEADNYLSFNLSGRLVEVASKGRNRYIYKVIFYNQAGNIEKYYDSRNGISKDRYIKFEYKDNLLYKMSYINNNKEVETIYYNYVNNNLKGFYRFNNKVLSDYGMYEYDNLGKLKLAISPTGQAIKAEHDNNRIYLYKGYGKAHINSLNMIGENDFLGELEYAFNQEITIGEKNNNLNYLNDELTIGELLNTFRSLNDDTSMIDRFSTPNEINTNEYDEVSIFYDLYYTEIIKSGKIKYRYYKNTLGEIKSQFEVRGNDLLTLNKDVGYCLMREMGENEVVESINRKKILQTNLNIGFNCITSDINLSDEFKGNNFNLYYTDKIMKCNNFVVSFWVKHSALNAKYIRAQVKMRAINDISFTESINIDEKAYEAWQYVEVPISFNGAEAHIDKGISYLYVRLMSDDNNSKYCISNVRIRPASRQMLIIKNPSTANPDLFLDITQYYKIVLGTSNGTKEIVLNEDNYITQGDFFKTLRNMDSRSNFDFIYCNGKKRIINVNGITVYPYEGNDTKYEIRNMGSVLFLMYDFINRKLKENEYYFYDDLIETYEYAFKYRVEYNKEVSEVTKNLSVVDKQGRTLYLSQDGKGVSYEYDYYGNLLSMTTALSSAFDSSYQFKQKDDNGNYNKRLYVLNIYDDNSGYGENRENIVEVKNESACLTTSYNKNNINEITSMQSLNVSQYYTYDSINRLINITNGSLSNHIKYNSIGQVEEIAGNKNRYKYEYDNDGNINNVSICVDGKELKLMELEVLKDNNLKVINSNLLTNTKNTVSYDEYGRVASIEVDDGVGIKKTIFTYQKQNDKISTKDYSKYMDESPSLASIASISDGYSGFKTSYIYDSDNTQIGYEIKDKEEQTYIKIEKEESGQIAYNVGGTLSKVNMAYEGDDNKFANLDGEDTVISKYTYTYEYNKAIGNVSKRVGGNSSIEYDYSYNDNSSYYSIQAQKIKQQFGGNVLDSTFNYDGNSNLTKIIHTGLLYDNIGYSYDNLNRIKKENHISPSISFDYSYNEFNRLSEVKESGFIKKVFNYDELGRLLTYYKDGIVRKKYRYLSNQLNPHLVTVNGEDIRIRVSDDGRLTSYGAITYSYDYLGVRLSKTVNNQVTKYYYNQGSILGEDRPNGDRIRFIYDARNDIVGAKYYKSNGNVLEYEYVKDNTLNVVAVILDSKVVGTYKYDAWGNIINKTEDESDDFIKINPIRYKSYYYDIDTGLYYLQSRYYDPEIGAFFTADSVNYLDVKTIGGLNLYGYCYNNQIGNSYSGSNVRTVSTITIDGFIGNGNIGGNSSSWFTTLPAVPKALNRLSKVNDLFSASAHANIVRKYLFRNGREHTLSYLADMRMLGVNPSKGLSSLPKAAWINKIGYAVSAIDGAIIIYDNLQQGNSWGQALLDGVLSFGNGAVSAWVGGFIGTNVSALVGAALGSIIPIPGAFVGFFIGAGVGIAFSRIVDDVLELIKDGLLDLIFD